MWLRNAEEADVPHRFCSARRAYPVSEGQRIGLRPRCGKEKGLRHVRVGTLCAV